MPSLPSTAIQNETEALAWSVPRILPRLVVVLVLIASASLLMPALGALIAAGLAMYALGGARQSMESLSILALLLLIGGLDLSLMRWVVMAAAFVRVVWDGALLDAPWPRFLGPLLAFSATILLFSVLASRLPTVSAFKALSFTVGVATVFTSLYRTRHLSAYWADWFFTLFCFIVLASLSLYGTGLGYRRGAGFQGILSHPQTYGPVCSTIAAYLTGLCLFQSERRLFVLVATLVAWFGVYGSQSRTALLAAMLSLLLAGGIGLLKTQTWRPVVLRTVSSLGAMVAVLILAGFTMVFWSDARERVVRFMMKDDAEAAGSVAASLQESRGSLIALSLENWWSAPLTGIGFGVPSDMEHVRIETGAFGLPVGASVEKGFMPSAVLEESGIVGAALVVLLLLYLFAPIVQRGSLPLFWLASTCLLINMGEMVFFSVGGMGFHFWIVMAFCHVYSLAAPPPGAWPAGAYE